MDAPQFPVGEYLRQPENSLSRDQLIATIEAAPSNLRSAVAGLSNPQLESKYRNWTIRQIVHHVADSHMNAFLRFKWTLTEDLPTIKPYAEGLWVELADSKSGDLRSPLALLEGLHLQWSELLRSMTESQFCRCYFHPESGQNVSLDSALGSYAWHGRHHTAQINWLRLQNQW